MANVLVVDDDTNILEVIRTRLEANGYCVDAWADPRDALERLKDTTFDVIVSDVRMPRIDGLEFLGSVRRLGCDVPVILLTAYGTIPNAVEAMRQGAYQYLTKPFQGRDLLRVIEEALEDRAQNLPIRQEGTDLFFPGVFGKSPGMQALLPLMERIVDSDSTVLIQGESGTGKELFARAIHLNGKRRENRFVILDCGATPPSLIESELFGHARGAFTNATELRKGLFEMAHGGTLFLDEISSLPLDLQTRLLRVLQERQVRRVGDHVMRRVDVRIVAATNVDLQEQVERGGFRLDLFYRLAVLRVRLPALRERREDIPLLADYFLKRFARKMGRGDLRWVDDVHGTLQTLHWPGNVRELKNAVEAAVVLAPRDHIGVADLRAAGLPGPNDPKRSRDPGAAAISGLSLPEFLERQERALIRGALEANNWVQKDAAEQLGVSPRVLCYKIKKLKIDLAGGGSPEG